MGSLFRYLHSLTIFPKLYPFSFSVPFSSSSFSSSGIVSESVSYLRSMFRPPPAVESRKLQRNSCSLIGTLACRVQGYGVGRRGAFTFLEVKSDPRVPNSSRFCVCLQMQGRLAEISLKHLKPNDFIYVSGKLGSYEKLNVNGEPEIFYKVYVKDLNYVRQLNQSQTEGKPATPMAGELFASPSGEEKHENQASDPMHLWQLFFASPSEWWDNRRWKKNSSTPDFKHKDTKECLWLIPNDPPWIKKQLQLYDASIANGRFNYADSLFETFN